ncbi:protein Abitram [Atheta coriaria]|uniref:protein Abitram n=1 Tax=Dalotia coriaria TaxID=877792 RepID=UPI0031F38D7E
MEYKIIDSIDKKILDDLISVSDRYYTHKYCTKIQGIDEALRQRISFHSNRLCMLSLADNHPAMEKTITKVNFEISDKLNRLKNVVSGKGKKGAQKLEGKSIVCYVETNDGEKYPVYSCLKGKLLEINNFLIEKPDLIQTHPVSNGYIALLLPDLKYYAEAKECMLDEAEYLKICNETSAQ